MKVDGYGRAGVLSPAQLKLLFEEGFECPRDRALFAICFFTGCRISEAIQLRRVDITATHIVFRKCNTKGKLDTREARIAPGLATILIDYPVKGEFMFPSNVAGVQTINRTTADKILRSACSSLGIKGVSTHSFRRTALTMMHNSGVSLRTIQTISGHRRLDQLSRYLEVSDAQLYEAVQVLSFY